MGGVFGRVSLPVVGRYVFAPRDLPPHAVGLKRSDGFALAVVKGSRHSKLFHPLGDAAILLEQSRHEIRAGIKHAAATNVTIHTLDRSPKGRTSLVEIVQDGILPHNRFYL